MDSVLSWIVLAVIVYFAAYLAARKAINEKEQYRSENDAFFREHEKK
jgi:hypothetical protein